MKINFKIVKNNSEKVHIMKKCDSSLPLKLFERSNCNLIINKIIKNAIFLGVFDLQNMKCIPIGYAAFYANDLLGKSAFISSICILDQYQRCNIGSSLLEECIKLSKNNGMEVLRLEVLKTNDKAISFYKRWGFKFEEAKEKTFYMKKNIA